MTVKRFESLCASAIALAIASSALGQTAPAEAKGDVLEEVMVTAERRVESAQKTPIAMNVFGAEDLATAGVQDIQGLTRLAPSLSFNTTNGSSSLALRGVSSTDLTEVGDPAVVVAVDDFFVNRPYSLSYGFFDIARVEVLRGPQGTLYGRNAVGGVVSIVTNKPDNTLAGRVSVTTGNYNTINTEGMINVPLAEDLALRASFLTLNHRGYRDVTLSGQPGTLSRRGDDADSKAVRVQLGYNPGAFSALVTAQQLHAGGVGTVAKAVPFTYDANGFLSRAKMDTGSSTDFTVPTASSLDTTDQQVRWKFSYDALPGGMTITYLGGHDKIEWHRTNNSSNVTQPFSKAFFQNEYPVTTNHELRLSSADTSRFTWQFGGFYFKEKSHLLSTSVRQTTGFATTLFTDPDIEAESKAVYGQASLALTDTLTLTAGARHTKDSKLRKGTAVVLGTPASQDGSEESSKTTYRAGLDWSPTPGHLLYATYSTGYKAGGFNTGSGNYRPENLRAYEVGSKNHFLDDHLQLNLAAFDYNYTDLQTLVYITNAAVTSIVDNAKKATVRGVELQMEGKLNSATRVNGEIDYLHAKFSDYVAAAVLPLNPAQYPNCSIPVGTLQNCQLAGNTLPYSPQVTFTIGLEHDLHLSNASILTVRGDTRFVASQNFDSFGSPATEQGSFSESSLTATYSPEAGNWDLGVYVRNLEDSTIHTDMKLYNPGNAQSYIYSYAPPRTYGAFLAVRF